MGKINYSKNSFNQNGKLDNKFRGKCNINIEITGGKMIYKGRINYMDYKERGTFFLMVTQLYNNLNMGMSGGSVLKFYCLV